MSMDHLTLAQQIIERIQMQFDSFRKETYKTVHDQIGSTLSAASIKAKLLGDKTSDIGAKKQIQDMHNLIKECMGYVTVLNRQLKQGWTPQSKETFFDDFHRELENLGNVFRIKVKLEYIGSKPLNKLNFSDMITMYEWGSEVQKNAITRLAENIGITIRFEADHSIWEISDDAPISPDSTSFQHLVEKTKKMGGNFQIKTANQKHQVVLTLPLGLEP